MRILFTFIGGSGHWLPLMPLARAAQRMGHAVAFGCGQGMAPAVQAEGFQVFPLGTGNESPPKRLPLRPLDAAREAREFRDGFARTGAQQRAPLAYALCVEWQPDVLVCDETDFGGMVAAERFGIPYAIVNVIAAGSFVRPEQIGDVLDELRAQNDLPPDPGLKMLYRYLVLSPVPPSFRDPAYPLPATAFSYRPFELSSNGAESPLSIHFPTPAPLVYFTLGTVFNLESGDLFTRVLEGLRGLSVNAVVTAGTQIDPAEFGELPGNIVAARFIPQNQLISRCVLVISHGGSGSVLGALAHGTPMVLLPMGADQPLNAARCAALGVGEWLDPTAVTPESVRDAVTRVLSHDVYRKNAARVREEFSALPGVMSAAEALTTLVK